MRSGSSPALKAPAIHVTVRPTWPLARSHRLRVGLGTALLLLPWAGPAQAEPTEPPAAPPTAAAEPAAASSSPAKSKEDLAKEHFARGNAFFLAGKYPEAGIEYNKTLELMPNLANPHKNLARCYLALKQENMYPDAAFHLLRFRQLKPQDTDRDVATDLRNVVAALKLPGRAGAELTEVAQLLEQQATAAAEEEKWSLAILRLQQLRELFPERSELLKLLAESYLGAYRCDDAKHAYQAYLLVHPEEKDKYDVEVLANECREDAREKGVVTGVPGKLVVLSNVTGAVVLIDGKRMGNTPLDAPARVVAGAHVVALFKEGYETQTAKVNVAAGATEQIRLDMVKLDMGTPLPATGSHGLGDTVVTGEAPPRPGVIVLQPQVGFVAALSGSEGAGLGPSFLLKAAYLLTERLNLGLEAGFHLLFQEFDSHQPFTAAQLSSRAIPLMAQAEYRHPLGPVRLDVGLAAGLLLAATTVSGDGGEAQQSGTLAGLRLHGGVEYPLGPGALTGLLSYLIHPFNEVRLTYKGDTLVERVDFGGLALHLGYRYTF